MSENQPPELPDDWRRFGMKLCWLTIEVTNPENFSVHVRGEGWEKITELSVRDSVAQTRIIAVVCILLPSLSCKLIHLFS